MSDRVIVGGSAPAHDPDWQLNRIIGELRVAQADWRARNDRIEVMDHELPSREAVRQIPEALRGALLPIRLGPTDLHEEGGDFYVGHTPDSALNAPVVQMQLELRRAVRQAHAVNRDPDVEAVRPVRDFVATLPVLRRLLDTDVLTAYHGDPAVHNIDEVLLCYSGILTVIHHRAVHRPYRASLPLLVRMVAETAHADTGIDIHPGTQIGSDSFIDHGTGVATGETAVIGKRV